MTPSKMYNYTKLTDCYKKEHDGGMSAEGLVIWYREVQNVVFFRNHAFKIDLHSGFKFSGRFR